MTEAIVGQTLSKTAERAYWLGRYLERVENSANLLLSFSRLIIDLPLRTPALWSTLIDITGTREHFSEHYDESSERAVCRWLINDQRNAGSLLQSASNARENARTLQGVIPRVAYEYVNELLLECRESLTEPLSRSRRTDGLAAAIEVALRTDGFLSGNMLHDDVWRFYRLGVFVERADMTTRVIDLGASTGYGPLEELDAFAELRWRMVLRSRGAEQNYRRCYQEPISQATVLDFLLRNPALPSSLQYCVTSLQQSLRSLPRPTASTRTLAPIRRAVKSLDIDALTNEEASALVDDWQEQLAQLHDKLTRTYFEPDRLSEERAGEVRSAHKQ
ncbi:MAG: alpha-E domain-containing protein [Pseudomonadota bacterium]